MKVKQQTPGLNVSCRRSRGGGFIISPMSERRQKRLRAQANDPTEQTVSLQGLVRRGGVTSSALRKVVDQLRATPGVDVTTSLLQEANLVRFYGVRHIERVESLEGTEISWEFCEPNLLLSRTVASSQRLQTMYRDALMLNPCSPTRPWDVCIAFDESVPGKVLAPNNARKFMVLSYNFLQLGQESLWHDDTWMTPVILRTSLIKEVAGGWSAMLRLFLHRSLFSDTGIATAGTPIDIGEDTHHHLGEGEQLACRRRRPPFRVVMEGRRRP